MADFNQNGRTDYALFNPSTRQTAIYYLSGTVYVSSAFGPTIASGYELMGTADFNGNGKPDDRAVQRQHPTNSALLPEQ